MRCERRPLLTVEEHRAQDAQWRREKNRTEGGILGTRMTLSSLCFSFSFLVLVQHHHTDIVRLVKVASMYSHAMHGDGNRAMPEVG